MLNGVLGLVTSSIGTGKLGPRSVARTSASVENAGGASGMFGACRNALTIVAKPLGTVCCAGSTLRPIP